MVAGFNESKSQLFVKPGYSLNLFMKLKKYFKVKIRLVKLVMHCAELNFSPTLCCRNNIGWATCITKAWLNSRINMGVALNYSRHQLIMPWIIQPAAYHCHFTQDWIFMKLKKLQILQLAAYYWPQAWFRGNIINRTLLYLRTDFSANN